MIPQDTSLHQQYTFYIKASDTVGGANGYFGIYEMNIGCFAGSVTFSDNGSLVVSVSKFVGDSLGSVYTFALPTSTRAWCV